MKADLHIVGPQFSSFVRSVMLCCEEKGVSYTWGFQLESGKLRFGSQEHLDLHPFGQVPSLIHGDFSLFETAPICRYIDNAFEGPSLVPSDPKEKAIVDQWSQAISIDIDQVLVREYLLPFTQTSGDEKGSHATDDLNARVENSLKILSKQLGSKSFFALEDYSIADALLTPILDYLLLLPSGKVHMEAHPTLTEYTEAMRNRPSGEAVLKTRTLN